ncbi:thiamine-phosphate synthase [Abditibacteriota bacterium]|nr:thiamine-phosphate synthase [Abditibacteriota bacterium]
MRIASLTGRLYLVATPRPNQSNDEFVARVTAALDGGVDVLQLRCKEWEALPIIALAHRLREVTAAHSVPFWINDRVDIALATQADGVHLGQNDLPVEWSRRIAPNLAIGRSTHAPEQARPAVAEQPDYIATGPVYVTPTKPGRAAVGLEYVRWAAANVQIPWYAIGGIDASNIEEVVEAGASRVVVVRAILDAPDPAVAASQLRIALTS